MSRKHYKEVAEIIRVNIEPLRPHTRRSINAEKEELLVTIARDLADMFKRDNPNFRRDRFYSACGLEEYQ